MKLILRAAAWLVLLAILAVTISPIQFRPVTGEPVNLERLAAFLVVGGLFALALSAPLAGSTHADCGLRRTFRALQRITPGRHGEFHDFLFKAAGAAIGVAVGHSLSRLRPFRQIE